MSQRAPSNVADQASEHVTLCVQSQDGEKLYFKTRRDNKIKKLLESYCEKKDFVYRHVDFLIDGRFFNHAKTIDALGLEEGDYIDAMMRQAGGGRKLE